jgi:TctA family transporter
MAWFIITILNAVIIIITMYLSYSQHQKMKSYENEKFGNGNIQGNGKGV